MIRHYLTFVHQARALDEALQGWRLAECWSQEKNTLTLRFVQQKLSLFVEVSLDPQVGYALLREELARARRNTIDFFGTILGVQLNGVSVDEGERAIRMRFADGHVLAFFFFGGGGGNVLLLDREGNVQDSFMKYSGEYDALLSGEGHDDLRDAGTIMAALRASDDPPARALQRAIPELGRRLATEALLRAGLESVSSLASLEDESLERLLQEVDVLYGACETSRTFYLYYLPDEVVFSLIRLRSLEGKAEREETFDSIGRATRAYRSAGGRFREFSSSRDRIIKRLSGEKSKLERSLANRLDSGAQLQRAAGWELEGNLLMSNLQGIERGSSRVVLADWDGNEHEIALDPKLSPVENAERLYRRARGARDAASRGERGLEKDRRRLEHLAALLERAARATDVSELEEIEKNNREIFVMSAQPKVPGSAERFRRFEVAGGHEVYAGKNASNNDELTVKFARPNDYWFHARGSSGSHVVLRWNDPKTKPPKDALRQAASVAAYYSGARGAKMVPVAYTLKKYVRKPKGAAVGAVVMEREEVIMVEPKLPQGAEEQG